MTLLKPPADAASISDRDVVLARESGRAIAGILGEDDTLHATFESKSGERIEATLPAFAVKLLARILLDTAQGGRPVTARSLRAEATTHEAARMLHVSRPFLIKLLEEGKIPYRKVGTHRRIRQEDIQAYLDRENAARRETLCELAAYDQEIGLETGR